MSATISRRHALQAAGWTATALFTTTTAAQQQRRITVEDIMGPYYPIQRPLDEDADLTRVDGQPGVAQGTRIDLRGRVVDTLGQPVAGAWIEMWQANTHGRYAHATDANEAAPLDPAFQGFGRQETDAEGRFRFLTIVPGAYPIGTGPDQLRTPHIHFKVQLDGQDLLTTQLYVAGDPGNERDFLWRRLNAEGRTALTVPFVPGADGAKAIFPIVVQA